jgi:hypothetical protein
MFLRFCLRHEGRDLLSDGYVNCVNDLGRISDHAFVFLLCGSARTNMEQVERIGTAQVSTINCIVEPLEYGDGVDDNKKTELFLPLTAKPGNLVEHENGDAPFVFHGFEDATSHDINYSSENIDDDSNSSQSRSSFSPNDAARDDTQGNFMKTIFKSHGPPQLFGLCLLMALAGGVCGRCSASHSNGSLCSPVSWLHRNGLFRTTTKQ